MLNDKEQAIWEKSVEAYGPFSYSSVIDVPLLIKTNHYLQGVMELDEALRDNYLNGRLSDKQYQLAKDFTEVLIATKKANEIVREQLKYNYIEENKELELILEFPNIFEIDNQQKDKE